MVLRLIAANNQLRQCFTWIWNVKIFLYVRQLCNIFQLLVRQQYQTKHCSSNVTARVIMQCCNTYINDNGKQGDT